MHTCTPDSPLPNPHMYMYLTSHKQTRVTRTLDIHVCTLLPQVNLMVHVTSVPWLITILLIFSSPAAAWMYISQQVALWWIFHFSMVFCTVFWPFKYHYWKRLGYFKYIHIVMVAVALIAPIIPPVICYKTGGYVVYFLIRPNCMCGKKHSSILLFSRSSTHCCCGHRTIPAYTHILFRGIYILVLLPDPMHIGSGNKTKVCTYTYIHVHVYVHVHTHTCTCICTCTYTSA